MADSGRTVFGGGGVASTPLRTPDFTKGATPGFGVEGGTLNGSNKAIWNWAYTLDDTLGGTDVAIDDEWCAWNPAVNPERLTVKQAGFYWVAFAAFFSVVPTTWSVSVLAPDYPKVYATAYSEFGGQQSAVVLPVPANTYLLLSVDTETPTPALSFASLTLVPMFT